MNKNTKVANNFGPAHVFLKATFWSGFPLLKFENHLKSQVA